MQEKLKLTELTKEELRQVRGGISGAIGTVQKNCDCHGNRQYFGYEDSEKTIKKPISPITNPITQP